VFAVDVDGCTTGVQQCAQTSKAVDLPAQRILSAVAVAGELLDFARAEGHDDASAGGVVERQQRLSRHRGAPADRVVSADHQILVARSLTRR
jgi:hypothetical protein